MISRAIAALMLVSSAWVSAQPAPAQHPRLGAWGVELGDQDRSIRPGEDFFRYQNGGWLAQAAPDATHPFMSYWRDVRGSVPPRLSAILEQLAAEPASRPDNPLGKAATLYREYMDEAAVERRGLAPLEPELVAIRGARTMTDIAQLMGRMEGPLRLGAANMVDDFGRGMFTMAVRQDRQDPAHYALYLGQGGLMLPDATYYSRPELADLKAGYQHYVEQVLTLIGWPESARRAREIVAFETEVAAASTPLEVLTDPARAYNPVTFQALQRLAPGFAWAAYFRGASLAPPARIIVDDPSAFARIATIYARADLDMLRARAAFATADYNAGLLGHDLYAAKFAFRTSRMFTPSLAAPSRAVGGERLIEAVMPETLGSVYVQRFSSPLIQARAERMAEGLRAALDARLQQADWLSPESRAMARRKLAAMQIHVGYPNRFDTYSSLLIGGDGLYEDVHRAAAYRWRTQVESLGRRFDRTRWQLWPMFPQYLSDPQANVAEVSAALFQPPFFDPDADDAVNYGAVGTIVAQQIMGGFDRNGVRFDADGHLADWLSPDERAHLQTTEHMLAERYSALEPVPGVHPRGQVLAGEAMQDIGAIQIALDAYHATLGGRPAPTLDNLTGDQRFFLGRAQSWRARFTDDAVRNQLAQGSNAVPWMRVNGPLPNLDAWYAAFDVHPGDKLYLPPDQRAHLW